VAATGIAAGTLLLHTIHTLTSSRLLREPTSHLGAAILACSLIYFGTTVLQPRMSVCVAPLGGMGAHAARPQEPLQYVYWLLAAPNAFLLVGDLAATVGGATAATYHQRNGYVALTLALVTGGVAAFVTTSWLWCALLAGAFVGGGFMLRSLQAHLWVVHCYSSRRNHNRLLVGALAVVILVAWSLFPLVYMLGQGSQLSPTGERVIWSLVDTIAKVAVVCILLGGSNYRARAELAAELYLAEARRRAAEASSRASRQFLR